jgi:two-component system sensor histidine kinase EvgS
MGAGTMSGEAVGRSFGRRIICAAMAFAALLALCGQSAHAAGAGRTVRVGYYSMSNFQEYDSSSGEYRGYSYDYMMAVAQYAGWQYEFVPVDYDEGVRMLEDGELDLMNGVEITDSLSGRLSFSSIPSGESCTCLVVSPDNTDVAYEDFQSFAGLTVGLDYSSSRNSGFVDYCKDNDCMPTLIYYHTAAGVAEGMKTGEINAYLISSLQDVNMRTVAKFGTQSYYFAAAKGDADLLQELNAAMNSLKTEDPYFEEKIYSKYHGKSAEEQTVISDSEKSYISETPVVRAAYDPAWYPLSYTGKDGKFAGAMASIMELISERTGLKFEYVPCSSATEAAARLKSGDVQIIAGFPYDYTWAGKSGALVTLPFTSLTVFAAYKTGGSPGSSVAVPEGSYLEYLSGHIRQDGYSFSQYGSTDDCLQAVLSGQADYAFLDSYQLEYYRERASYRNLSFKVANGDDYRLSLAVSGQADKRLYTIIGKTLSAAGSDELSNIFRETSIEAESRSLTDLMYLNPKAAGLIFTLLGFLLAVLASILIYSRAMNRKNRELRAATSAKSEFLSNMSHDMRTPLNGIMGYTELAVKTDDPEKKADYLNKIRISGQFLLSLINDTLDISKIESGKFALHPEPVSSGELLESIVVPMRQMADEKGVDFIVDTSAYTKGYILADRLSSQKVILNLLSNAVKFTPPGGTVWLIIADIEPPEDGLNTRVTVKDTGIGMSSEYIPNMFEPFTQEHAPESRQTVGTGLGLSIVKKIVTLMGGRIDVESKKGSGTKFDVLLPLEHLASPPLSEDEPRYGSDALKGKRALLCEDNEMNREIAVNLLQSFGMTVDCAVDGREGVDVFSASPSGTYDVVLMDLRMPVLGGCAASAEIRSLPRADAGSVPIIAMSADAYDDDLRRCAEAGMNGHVSKPIDPKTLFSELAKHCGGGGKRDENK